MGEDFTTVIEVHPLLGACQIFIFTDRELKETRLSLLLNSIEISVGSETKSIPVDKITLKPKTMSNLQSDKNSIFFRVQIELKNSLELSIKKVVPYKPSVNTSEDVRVYCRCCEMSISKVIHFKRVLPLPSEGCNFDDWFCHKHDNGHSSFPNLDNVSESDCLYDSYFIKINSNHIVNEKVGVIHCNKCLSWLGMKTEEYAKLWNSSVLFNNLTENISPLDDFINIILYRLSICIGPVFKMVVTCAVTDNTTHYLLLWVMDKNLTLLCSFNKEKVLVEHKAVKVFYNYCADKSDIVSMWLNDVKTESLEVSKQMFVEAFDSLVKSSEFIPRMYRHANNMTLGYLIPEYK